MPFVSLCVSLSADPGPHWLFPFSLHSVYTRSQNRFELLHCVLQCLEELGKADTELTWDQAVALFAAEGESVLAHEEAKALVAKAAAVLFGERDLFQRKLIDAGPMSAESTLEVSLTRALAQEFKVSGKC